jgi:hypothetical protein
MLVNPAAFGESQQWANIVCSAHDDAHLLQQFFTTNEHTTANRTAPRGYIITSAGGPSSRVQDILSTIPADTIPRLNDAAVAPKGVRFIASNIKRLSDWRALFELLSSAPLFTKPKLLTQSGHGNVSIRLSDIHPGRFVSASTTRATIRRITRAPCMGRRRMSSRTRCPQSGIATCT